MLFSLRDGRNKTTWSKIADLLVYLLLLTVLDQTEVILQVGICLLSKNNILFANIHKCVIG